jgi:hypothetical protein
MATKKSAEATRIEVRISVTDTPREIVVPAGKIGFIEIAAPSERKVGFATI